MELALISLKQIITMFLILAAGFFCFKKKLISAENNQALSGLVLNIVNPAVIFMSYQIEFTPERLTGLAFAVLLSAVSFVIMIVIAYILVPARENNSGIERIALIYSNCGFIGIPLIQALIGEIGVFYLAAYLTIFNVLLWTQGVILMTGKTSFKETLKSLCSPCIIAVFLGVVCFLLKFSVPQVAADALNHIASMNTPLAMLVAGVTIARTDILKAFTRLRVYYMVFLKLLVIPLAVTAAMLFFGQFQIDREIIMMVVIATACPTGASGTLFAIRYHKDELYASELFGVSTIFSIVTIPVVIMVSDWLGVIPA